MGALGALAPLVIKIGIDPQIAKVGGLEIGWHGVLTALGVSRGGGGRLARRAGFDEDNLQHGSPVIGASRRPRPSSWRT
jgi:hypothetical protein